MSTHAPMTLPTSPEEMRRLMADPAAAVAEPMRTLLRRCAAVQSFDQPLFAAVLGVDLPATDHAVAVQFAELVKHPFVEPLPAAGDLPPRYQVAASLRAKIFEAAWIAQAGMAGDPSKVTQELRQLSEQLAAYFEGKDDYAYLFHLIAADQLTAARRFAAMYQAAELSFDLARCHALIRVFDERNDFLSSAIKEVVNRRRFRLDARAQWSDEYYSTLLYFERDQTSQWLDELIGDRQRWILHIYAAGGTGKTMYIRHLIARRCVRARIPVAYVDFDQVLMPDMAVAQPWRILISLIEQIDSQIEGRPFGELLNAYGRFQHPTDARDFVRMRTPVTVAREEERRLRDELIQRFASTLTEARGDKPAVFIFDTLENLRQRRLDMTEIYALLHDLGPACPGLRVVLSGRYNLGGDSTADGDAAAAFRALLGDQQQTRRLEAFSEDEARAYLREIRSITEPALVDAIVLRAHSDEAEDAARINPFKLSLLADLVIYAPGVTAQTILEYEAADTAYLIERVVDRIEHRLVRFVLRYGVVPRFLTRDYLAEVLQPYLVAVAEGRMDLDNPQVDALHDDVLQRKPFSLADQAGATVDIDALWAELTSFTSPHSWVSPVGGDVVRFHPDVVEPMLRLLRKSRQPILLKLHGDTVAYCERSAERQAQQRGRWLSEAIYHKLAAGDADVLAYWQSTWERMVAETGENGDEALLAMAKETLAQLADPITDPTLDPGLAARQTDLQSVIAYTLALLQLQELAPSDIRRLLALVESGDPATTQIGASGIAALRAQLELREGRSKDAATTARTAADKVIVELDDRVIIGGVTLQKRIQNESTRIIAEANLALGERDQAIATLRAGLTDASPQERSRLLAELAALYEQQGNLPAALAEHRALRTEAIAQNDPLPVAATTVACVRLLTAIGEEEAAAQLAMTTSKWVATRTVDPSSDAYWRNIWLAERLAAESDLAGQRPGAAQERLWQMAANEGVARLLKNSGQSPEGAALSRSDTELRSRVAAACLDLDSAFSAFEQLAYDSRDRSAASRSRAMVAAITLALDSGDYGRAERMLPDLQSMSDEPAIVVERQLVQVRTQSAVGAHDAARTQLADMEIAQMTPPQQVRSAILSLAMQGGADEAWRGLVDALAQLTTPAWRLAMCTLPADLTAPGAAQAAALRDLVTPEDDPSQFPLGRLRYATVLTALGDKHAATAELDAVQAFVTAQGLWPLVRTVYAARDAVGWSEAGLLAAPLPPDSAAEGAERYLVGVIWLEHGLRLLQHQHVAQGAELVERSAAVLSPQSPWFARIMLGRAKAALLHGDDGAGRQLAETAASAFASLGDPGAAAAARSLTAAITGGDDSAGLESASISGAIELEIAVQPDGIWLVTAQYGAAGIAQWRPAIDATLSGVLGLRAGEAIGSRFVTEFAKAWIGWGIALGELATTAPLREILTGSTEPRDLRWQIAPSLAWLPWEFAVIQAPAQQDLNRWDDELATLTWQFAVIQTPSQQQTGAPPIPYVLTAACRYGYRSAEAPRFSTRLAPPAPDAPVLVLRPSDVSSRMVQRGYSTFADANLVRRYQGANLPAYEISENDADALERMVQELRPRIVHIAAGLVESGRHIGLNIAGDPGFTKSAPPLLGATELRRIFSNTGVAPLLIVDPPAPPGISERVRQLCLRNAFADEMAQSGLCTAVLATGLGDPSQQDTVARILVGGLAERRPPGELLRQFWAQLGERPPLELEALLPFAGAALFAADPSVPV